MKKRKTAAELLAELAHDPEYGARQREQEEQRRRLAQVYRKAAAPLLAELAAAGFDVASVGALRQPGREYRGAVPILLDWLPRIGNPDVREDIVRSLSVPFARPAAAPALVAEFRRTTPAEGTLRWAIGNGLEVVADDSVYQDVVEIARDRRNGTSREMFVLALGNMSRPDAAEVLMELLDDDEVAGHAIMALHKLKAPRSRHALERFLDHPKPWIRKEARKAIAAIDKAGRQPR